MTAEDLSLIAARSLVNPISLASKDSGAATVGCVLVAASGRSYEGVCIDLPCGLGFCAEAAAMAAMLKDGETHIGKIVAVAQRGVLSPCGRCREMMVQLDNRNKHTAVLMPDGLVMEVGDLLPASWL